MELLYISLSLCPRLTAPNKSQWNFLSGNLLYAQRRTPPNKSQWNLLSGNLLYAQRRTPPINSSGTFRQETFSMPNAERHQYISVELFVRKPHMCPAQLMPARPAQQRRPPPMNNCRSPHFTSTPVPSPFRRHPAPAQYIRPHLNAYCRSQDFSAAGRCFL